MAKVLLAEDSNLLLKIARTMLEKAGHSVLQAKDGKEAVSLAKKEKPDVIVMDAEMPEMSGIDACRALKSDAATKTIPVHIYTGNEVTAETAAQFRAVGVLSCHTKPYNPEVLLGLIPK